jgi:hypothetical protein
MITRELLFRGLEVSIFKAKFELDLVVVFRNKYELYYEGVFTLF